MEKKTSQWKILKRHLLSILDIPIILLIAFPVNADPVCNKDYSNHLGAIFTCY